tara:strand:+ start:1601 stop:2533 length:933 start_codon:yes stop_codon:yes gene_type:complete
VKPALHILTGYTAVGKTSLSLGWAKKNNAEILSCDSLLFYRGMNIGTAKPAAKEMAEIPHHMIDIRNVNEQYSISEYLKKVREIVAAIQARGRQVLVVGGSGFYLNAFFAPVVDELELKSEALKRIDEQFENQPLEDSLAELSSLNPDGLGGLDTANPRRVLKAWLRCVATGKPILQLMEEFAAQAGAFDGYDKYLLVLERPREQLERRVRLRVDQMIEAGLIEEVKKLLELGILENPSAASAIGYRETIACLKGDAGIENLADDIAQNTRKLLKKQRTWFKKFIPQEAILDVSSLDLLPDDWCFVPAKK